MEVGEGVRGALDQQRRNQVRLHDLSLINAQSGTRRLEKCLAKATIRARDSRVHQRLGRFAEDRMDENLDVSLGQMLLPSQLHVRGTLEGISHSATSHARRA